MYYNANHHFSHNEVYRSLFENHPDAICIMDLNRKCIDANLSVSILTGFSTPEFLQISLLSIIAPEDVKRALQHIENAFKGIPQKYEVSINHKNGYRIELFMTHVPIVINNRIEGIYCIANDITERKQTEEEQRLIKNQLESFIENNVDAILILNVDGDILRVNTAFEKMFGWDAVDFLGKNLLNLPIVPFQKLDETKTILSQVRSGKLIVGFETNRLKKDGSIINVSLSVSPILDANGNVNGWSTILRDITERKKSEKMLIQSEKLSIVGELAAGIAHEVRNPLTAIKGFLQIMQKEECSHKKYLDIMIEELNRIELIVGEFLELAKPQKVQFKQKDILKIFREVIILLDTQALINNIQIKTHFEFDHLPIRCDEHQLKQVFINLLKNAIEAMPKGGTISIHLKNQQHDKIHIRFIDQGNGIPKEQISMLGQAFYTTKEKGTGLGLMISKRIIENHQGTLNIDSQMNVGTTIDVILPTVQ